MTDKLHEPGEALAYVGAEDFCFFKCYTQTIWDAEGKPGVLETEYRGLKSEFDRAPNKQLWLMAAARRVVTHAAISTKTDVSLWVVEFSPMFGYLTIPSHLFLKRSADRAWLGL